MKFIGRHLSWSLFFNKIADLTNNFITNETPALVRIFFKKNLFCKIPANNCFWVLNTLHADLISFKTRKMPNLVTFRPEFKKKIIFICEISTFEFVKMQSFMLKKKINLGQKFSCLRIWTKI